MKSVIFSIASLFLTFIFSGPAAAAITATSNGTVEVYGDPIGLARVEILEKQLNDMAIIAEHPRIMLTPQLLSLGRQRVAAGHGSWTTIQTAADSGNIIAQAFSYLILKDSQPAQAATYATSAYKAVMAASAPTWTSYTSATAGKLDRNIAAWALCFDWIYNALDATQRSNMVAKIATSANIEGRAAWIRAGNADAKETFHREEWIFRAWQAWPEIALAGHYTDADFCYKTRWSYNWYWGDAARVFAYLNDGTPLEGYQYGADATSWFMALKSSTGINLVDGEYFHYDVSAADYQLYGTDFGLNRNIFHRGIGAGAGGLWTYTDTLGNATNWKLLESHSMATQLTAPKNKYQQWIAKNILLFDKKGASSWIFSNEYYNNWNDFEAISTLLFYDPTLESTDPRTAKYSDLPFAKHFPGGNEVYMRSSWGNDAAMACLRSTPAFTKSSHGDYDVNTFLLYRKGNLSMDSGVYDNLWGQKNTFWYQKNTVAHNNLLIVDPTSPDAPTKLSASPDPGGTDAVSTYSFGTTSTTFPKAAGAFLLRQEANWGDISAFETNENFDYAVGEAPSAYNARLSEYNRSTMFIRKPGDKAYFVVYDRVNATNATYTKKWLLHTVEEPTLNGSILSTEVAGHIYTTDGDNYSATNAFNNSTLYGKVLLPKIKKIRKVGGTGYEFWVDGSTPQNIGIDWTTIAPAKEPYMGGPLKEIGQWRLELMPATQQQRDLFLNVIYLGDTGEPQAKIDLVESSEGKLNGAYIQDAEIPTVILFGKESKTTSITGVLTYTLPQSSLNAKHIIADLSPNTLYTVTLLTSTGSNQTYQITSGTNSTGTTYKTTVNGILQFAPNGDTAASPEPAPLPAPTIKTITL